MDPLAAVERCQGEAREWQEEHAKAHVDIERRLARGEFACERIADSLAAGNGRFLAVDERIRSMAMPWRWIIGLGLLPAVGLIIALARAPQRDEMDAARARIEAVEKATIEIRGDIKLLTEGIRAASRRGVAMPMVIDDVKGTE